MELAHLVSVLDARLSAAKTTCQQLCSWCSTKSFSVFKPLSAIGSAGMGGKIKVAAAHVSSVFMNAAESADKAVQWVEKAAADGADLLVFPETFIPGFPVSHT